MEIELKLFSPTNKMERLKVTELKALSKSLGLRGCSRLRKADLVKLIMDHLNSRPRPVPRHRQSKDPPKDVMKRRPPKPTRPPPPQPRPPLRRYQLREKGSATEDVQKPDGMEESREVKYDPKSLNAWKGI